MADDASGVASLEVSGMMAMTFIGQTIQLAATVHMLIGSSQAIASESADYFDENPWSKVIGATHNTETTLWAPGGMASIRRRCGG